MFRSTRNSASRFIQAASSFLEDRTISQPHEALTISEIISLFPTPNHGIVSERSVFLRFFKCLETVLECTPITFPISW